MKFLQRIALTAGAKVQNKDNADVVALLEDVDLPRVALVLAASAAIPLILKQIGSKIAAGDLNYRIAWLGAFILNIICVSIPGRFDGQMVDGKISVVWRSAFAPSGWAFAIWGIIYFFETLTALYITAAPSSWDFGHTVSEVVKKSAWGSTIAVPPQISGFNEGIKKATPYWIAGNLYQCLWCYSFRPSFRNSLYVPGSLLAVGAYCLFGCHSELTRAIQHGNTIKSKVVLMLLRFPISLHASWLTAASLLNFNGWAAITAVSFEKMLALATFSAYAAAALGGYLTLNTRDAGIGFTFAWALMALADKTSNNSDVKDFMGLVAVKALGLTERYLSYIVAVITLGSLTSFDKVIEKLPNLLEPIISNVKGRLKSTITA